MSVRIISAFALTCAMGLALGCDSMNKAKTPGPATDGEIAKTEGKLKIEQGNMMTKGEGLVRDGTAQKARGEKLIEQGKELEGRREVSAGEVKITQGEALIKEAKEMKTEIEAPPRPSSRSDVKIDAEPRTASERTTSTETLRPAARVTDRDVTAEAEAEVGAERPAVTTPDAPEAPLAPEAPDAPASTDRPAAEVDVDIDAQK